MNSCALFLTASFDKSCIAAYFAFKSALLEDSPSLGLQLPSFLYSSLVKEATPKMKQLQDDIKESLINFLCQLPATPSEQDLLKATKNNPLSTYIPALNQLSDQSLESYNEALDVFDTCIRAIDYYIAAINKPPTNLIISGGPGCEKPIN